MINIIRYGLLFFVLVASAGIAKTSNDTIVVERIILSNSVAKAADDKIHPGNPVEVITSKDELIYYSASIGVINPTKKRYRFKIICVDSEDRIIFGGSDQEFLNERTYHFGDDIMRDLPLYLRLDPMPGAIVQGRLLAWENNNDYFIKLFFEKKLIAVTKFHYVFEK